MDRYIKFILTMIAVALFGINYHLFSGDIISSAEARHNTNNTAYGEGSMHVTIDNWPQQIKKLNRKEGTRIDINKCINTWTDSTKIMMQDLGR